MSSSAAVELYNTTTLVAAEFKPGHIGFKTYFIPRWSGSDESLRNFEVWWDEGLRKIASNGPASAILMSFINTSQQGKLLTPVMIAVDNVHEANSRLKVYFRSPLSSISAILDMLTLGGRMPMAQSQYQDVRSLLTAITCSSREISDDAELPKPQVRFFDANINNQATAALTPNPGQYYYVDIAPTLSLPEVKFFLNLEHYGPNDGNLARRLTSWMDSRGRSKYCEQYTSMLDVLSACRPIKEAKGIHKSLSCMCKANGDLEVTSYLGPELIPQVFIDAKHGGEV